MRCLTSTVRSTAITCDHPEGGAGGQVVREESLLPSDAEVVPLVSPFTEAINGRFRGLKAFVAGATGGTGRNIVKQLVAQGVPVQALVRDPLRAVTLLPGSQDGCVELLKGDVYQFSTLPSAMAGCNVVLIATGSQPLTDPFGPYNVDYQGTVNIVAAAKQQGIEKIVLVSSIGADEPFFPLNLLFGVLFWKKRAEEEVQRSGIDYTIVRPGGLLNEPRQGQPTGGVVMEGPATFGLPPKRTPSGPILRSQVAEVCIEALVEPAASNKVVEVVTDQAVPARPYSELFASVW
ncbi:hypothetical protein WJX72_010823 [[Myrmecia] bisecta]|uniref:NAD(P)-binding domain-containing protein n=1 Tax=[Myrmecia] bisecta TaxID=41462 RepID=A0AAW1R9F5_9CHLO